MMGTKHYLEAEVTYIDEGRDDDGWERREWSVLLRYDGREMSTKFYTGMMLGEPTAEDVMQSLFSDAEGVEYDGFEAWAENYGFDPDSRKALADYEAIEEQTERFKEFCGSDYHALEELYRDA